MARVQKCAGGCGRSQDVTVDAKGGAKGSFTFQPPWTCQDCRAKEEKRRAAEHTQKDAAEAGPKKPPDKGFTLVPGRKTMVPPDLAKPTPKAVAPLDAPPTPPPAIESDAGDKEGLDLLNHHEATEPPDAAAEA